MLRRCRLWRNAVPPSAGDAPQLRLPRTLLEHTRAERERICEAARTKLPANLADRAAPSLSAWVDAGPACEADMWPAKERVPVTIGKYSFETPTSRELVAYVKLVLPQPYHKHLDAVIEGAVARRRADLVREEMTLRAIAEHDQKDVAERHREAQVALNRHQQTVPDVTRVAEFDAWTKKAHTLRVELDEAALAKAIIEAGAELHYTKLKEESRKSSFYAVVQWGMQNSWAVISVAMVIFLNVCIWTYRLLEYITGISISQRIKKVRRELAEVQRTADRSEEQLKALTAQVEHLATALQQPATAPTPTAVAVEPPVTRVDIAPGQKKDAAVQSSREEVEVADRGSTALQERLSRINGESRWSLHARYSAARQLAPLLDAIERSGPSSAVATFIR